MKKIILFFSLVFLFSCSKENDNASRIALLQVDYLTNVFEGGAELMFSVDKDSLDTIPIQVDYKSPGDFGNITLYYQPTDEMIFDGGVIWMGTGQINYPKNFMSDEEFDVLETPMELPDVSEFQIIFYNLSDSPIDYASIWSAINNLEIVEDYLKYNKKIGLFLYTPSVGVGNPAEWDWFVILNK